MSVTSHIPLTFGRNRRIKIARDGPGSADLAVILPGLRYGPDRPLLQEVSDVFRHRGCDLLTVVFDYMADDAFLNAPDEAQFAQIASDGRDIIDYAISAAGHNRLWVIGKSLGTLSMGAAFAGSAYDPDRIRAIWLTPSLLGTPLLPQMTGQSAPSLVILGSEDPSNLPTLTAPFSAAPHIALHVVPGVDHAFEHTAGAEASTVALAQATTLIADWVDRVGI